MSYKPEMDPKWYLKSKVYRWYTIREASVLFMVIYCINLLWGLAALSSGEESWSHWLAFQCHPVVIIWSIISILFTLYHTATWFSMAPRAMPPIWLGNFKLPNKAIVLGQWAGFFTVAIVLIGLWIWGATR